MKMPVSGLRIAISQLDGMAFVELEGELDYFEVAELRTRLLPPPARSVTLDLSKLDFIDAAGVSALVALGQQAEKAGSTLKLVNTPRHLRRIFELTAATYLLSA
jgi:anti-anti-sigma factor